jgi:4-alpha-glucanotransferase
MRNSRGPDVERVTFILAGTATPRICVACHKKSANARRGIMRQSGILMHISSLPSPYGIGTFGREAYRFVDFLKEAKQSLWQILPLGPTSFGDSPYHLFNFCGQSLFCDLDLLREKPSDVQDYKNINGAKTRRAQITPQYTITALAY